MTEQETQTTEETQEQTQETTGATQEQQDTGYRSQAEFDAAFTKRLERERKKLRDEMVLEAKATADKAKMDEAQKAAVEKDEAEARATEATSKADERVTRVEAKLIAHSLGVKPELVSAVIKLSDLSEVTVTKGEPDADELKARVEATLTEYPVFKPGSGDVGGGSRVESGSTTEKNPWTKEYFNLTEQGRIMEADPVKAQRMSKAAS